MIWSVEPFLFMIICTLLPDQMVSRNDTLSVAVIILQCQMFISASIPGHMLERPSTQR